MNYTPAKDPVNAFKAACKLAVGMSYREPPTDNPVDLELVFVMPRPKSAPKKQTERIPHTKKPDIDNLCKSVCDALTGILWHDDKQVYSVNVVKYVASIREQPGVELRVTY